MNLESYIQEIIYGRKTGFLASILKCLTLMMSYCFRGIVFIKNKLYDLNLLRKYRPPVPLVISIGNIVAGGTGKTPFVIFVAKAFQDVCKIAVLSRGYKSLAEHGKLPLILSDGKGPLYSAEICGDEPCLIAENLKDVVVIVGKNRIKSANMAAKLKCHLILLDDGFQKRSLAKDLEIVLIDAKDPFGQGYFLPRGLLRDQPSSLAKADFIVINHVDDSKEFFDTKALIEKYAKCPIAGAKMEFQYCFDFKGDIVLLQNKNVGLFCAIAKPFNFEQTVLTQEAIVLDEYFISDHLSFDLVKLEEFANSCRAKGIEMLVCTEKDFVKLPKNLNLSLPVVWVKIGLNLVYGNEEWRQFIEKAKKDIVRRM